MSFCPDSTASTPRWTKFLASKPRVATDHSSALAFSGFISRTFVRNTSNSSGYSLIDDSHNQALSFRGSSSAARKSEARADDRLPVWADLIPSRRWLEASPARSSADISVAAVSGYTICEGFGSSSNLIDFDPLSGKLRVLIVCVGTELAP